MKIDPLGKQILVKPLDPKDWPEDLGKEDSNLVVPDWVKLQDGDFAFGEVLATGPEIDSVNIKDRVIFRPSSGRPELNGRVFLSLGEILARYTE